MKPYNLYLTLKMVSLGIGFGVLSLVVISLLAPMTIVAEEKQLSDQYGKIIWLDSLDLSSMQQGWEKPNAKASVNGTPILINGKKFERGVGTHAISKYTIDLKGVSDFFHAFVGIDDEIGTHPGSVVFKVYVDGKKVYESGILKGTHNPPQEVKVGLKGAKRLDLIVGDAGDGINYDHADWADALISVNKDSTVLPEPYKRPVKEKLILTPKEKDTPRINGPSVLGFGENRDFLWYVPVSGKRPVKINVEGLPARLKFTPTTGIISGKSGDKGEFTLKITAENEFGKDAKDVKVFIGDGLSKTPPMGWNSWNCWGCSVDQAKVKMAADAMVASGLINHGWTYINIDDCWQGERDKITKKVKSNEKFPNMKALADYIHSKGLKFGVYTDSGTKTCGGYEGSKDHEAIDALTYAEWGVDYIKCDWCNTEGMDPEKAYQIMGDGLKACGRDITFSICNWGHKDPWKWGAQVGGNLWRTTGDIVDTWLSVYQLASKQVGLSQYAGPGHWNDPDMLVVGKVGWGPTLRDSKLTPDEQYSHISLWCLMSSPLILGCDLSQLDDFTKNLLTNEEVLAVNQDLLGKQAERIIKEGDLEVWAKDLSDGSKAVGIFNVGMQEVTFSDELEYTLKWSDLKLNGTQVVRDLWAQKDLGNFADSFKVKLPEGGCKFINLTKQN